MYEKCVKWCKDPSELHHCIGQIFINLHITCTCTMETRSNLNKVQLKLVNYCSYVRAQKDQITINQKHLVYRNHNFCQYTITLCICQYIKNNTQVIPIKNTASFSYSSTTRWSAGCTPLEQVPCMASGGRLGPAETRLLAFLTQAPLVHGYILQHLLFVPATA